MERMSMSAPQEASPAWLTKALILKHFLPVGKRTLDRMISAGKFPKADYSDGAKIRLWRRATIESWQSSDAAGVHL